MARRGSFNVPVDPKVTEEFDNWHKSVRPGNKCEKLTGALKAIQALHLVNDALAFQLMSPTLTIKDAKKLIVERVVDVCVEEFLGSLSLAEKSKILLDAKSHKRRVSRKK